MKILQIADIPTWAIGHLTEISRNHNPHFEFRTIYVHPKEVNAEAVDRVWEHLEWADIVDLQYWNTARQLLEFIPELHTKKLVLTHHNQKDLLAADWSMINHHVVHTNYAANILLAEGYEHVSIIPYGFDLSFFKYRSEEPKELVVGYCGRVVPWKGLKEIAAACFELGYPLLAMGKIDKPSYWDEIPEEHRANIDFSYMNVPDSDRAEFYNDITIYVGNSGPNHEEGTMPLQEAMASGVPVVTTPAGVAADILENGQNALLVDFNDYQGLKNAISNLMEDQNLRNVLRARAWQTIKLHTQERMAWEFAKVFYQVMHPDSPLVSVIIPTTPLQIKTTMEILDSLRDCTYPNFEVVLGFDQTHDMAENLPEQINRGYNFPIKLVCTEKIGGYNLAKSRNLAVIEAMGEYLLFCDSRLMPDKNAISYFMLEMGRRHKEKVWLFGEKGSGKKSFVENFSFIRRDQFIRAGMMNERIDHYGGMSQELRTRFQAQNFKLVYVDSALAKPIRSSGMASERRQDIIKSKLQLWKMGMK